VQLDPNAVYEIVAPPYAAKGTLPTEERLWDKQNQVMVNRWYLQEISEDDLKDRQGDVGKAETHVFRETDVVRDEAGRFAEEPDTTSTTSAEAPVVPNAGAPRPASNQSHSGHPRGAPPAPGGADRDRCHQAAEHPELLHDPVTAVLAAAPGGAPGRG
jgi:hypothetical protein